MRTPFSVFATLTVVGVSILVGGTAQPALAAPCDKPQAGRQISDIPWQHSLWDINKLPAGVTGRDVRVAVLDSGVDDAHPQLQGKVADFIDPLRSAPKVQDLCGHGTAVAGLIAAKKVSNVQFRGLAPESLILSARVSEQVGGNEDVAPISDAEMAAAVHWAVSKGAKVINISFVYTSPVGRDQFKAAIAEAIKQGVVVVAAVGNNNTKEKSNPVPYPAAWPGVVGVAAVAANGDRLAESGSGTYVDIAAPGVGVLVPRPGSGYDFDNGTSFAAPLVAATAALIFQRYPGIKGPDVVKQMLATADPAPGGRRSDGYGVGIVNPVRAVTEVIDDAQPVQARALPGAGIDPVAASAAAEAERLKQQAYWFSGIGIVAALLAVALMVALPAGIRRRWRPAGR